MVNNFKYNLYLASGIRLWKKYFSKEYSPYFNKKVGLFEPGVLDNPKDHRFIPINIACHDLDQLNHADALLVYMKYYESPDQSPIGTDSTWETGYAISKGKPVIMLIEDVEHIDYYATQWMVAFSINAVLTCNKKVAEKLKDHPKFVHTIILLGENKEHFETKIIEYLKEYYRSIYSRSGIINYYVDSNARSMFIKEELSKNVFVNTNSNKQIANILNILNNLKFKSDKDSLKVCQAEREISKILNKNLTLKNINSAIKTLIKYWNKDKSYILDCLEHSIKPPFIKLKRKQGLKKTRPELFYELYDLITHHLTSSERFVKSDDFPYQVGALIELYNWMNTYSLDDVFDNSEFRQNLETVWNAFTRRDAILTGIMGHLLILKYFFIIAKESNDIAKKLANIMNEYNNMMYEGQVLDLVLTFDSEQKKKLLLKKDRNYLFNLYVQRIYGICGGFYEAIGALSAKAGNKEKQITNAKEVDKISPLIGMYYGIIQMIRNDLGDYIIVEKVSKLSKGMKGVSHSDVIEGKTDIAYLAAMFSESLDKTEKDFLYKWLYKNLTQQDKLKINKLLWKSGAINLTVDLIINLINHVKETLLTKYHETPTRMKWMFNLVSITKEILIPFQKQALKHNWYKYEYDPIILDIFTKAILNLEKTPLDKRLFFLKDYL